MVAIRLQTPEEVEADAMVELAADPDFQAWYAAREEEAFESMDAVVVEEPTEAELQRMEAAHDYATAVALLEG